MRLPEPPTSFVGRDAELEALRGMLDQCRLLTIVGGAGLGKTRLAIALAARELQMPVHFVGLAGLNDGALLAPETAARLGVAERPGEPAAHTLADHIGPRPMLLLVDNCEHVIEASATLIGSLLHECPNLHVVATSRQPLRVAGEVTWQIEPLRVPDAGRLDDVPAVSAGEAVRLFEARARAVLPGFSLTPSNVSTVAVLCRRLEGIPLAIELAAGLLDAMSLEELLARLALPEDRLELLAGGDRFVEPRHRTLQAAIEWSHQLLDDRERRVFRQVSVFRGGFDLEAAEAVCAGGGIDAADVRSLVVRLAERSLLVSDSSRPDLQRYDLLETVREYGVQRLLESAKRTATAERHARHFLAVAERAAREERGREQPQWLRRLELDVDNFRSALAWLRARDVGRCLRLATALSWFWITRSHFSEGRRWLEDTLALTGQDVPARADGQLALARLCLYLSDYGAARAACRQCLHLRREHGDPVGAGWALTLLGSLHAYSGDYAESRACFELALDGADDVLLRMEAQVGLGEMLLLAGDPGAARASLQEIVRPGRGPEAPRGRAALFSGLAALFSGDVAEARTMLHWSVDVFRRLGNRYGAAAALEGLAGVAMADSDPLRALRLSAAASAIREATRSELAPAWRDVVQTHVVRPAMAATGAEGAAAWAEGRAMSFDDALSFAREEPDRGERL